MFVKSPQSTRAQDSSKCLGRLRITLYRRYCSSEMLIFIIIIIIHEFHGDTSLKQNFRAAMFKRHAAAADMTTTMMVSVVVMVQPKCLMLNNG